MTDPGEVERVAEALCDARNSGTAYVSLDTTEREWLRRMARWHLAQVRAHRGAAGEPCCHGWRGRPPERGERIVTPCPACGSQSLFIGTGGHLTCAVVPHGDDRGCPEPSVERAIDALRDAARRHTEASPPAPAWSGEAVRPGHRPEGNRVVVEVVSTSDLVPGNVVWGEDGWYVVLDSDESDSTQVSAALVIDDAGGQNESTLLYGEWFLKAVGVPPPGAAS